MERPNHGTRTPAEGRPANRAIEQQVAQHYARTDLEQAILDALVASSKDPAKLTPADLAPVDEFHTGGRQATIDFAEQIGFMPGMHLLDVGCGIGGAARFFAAERGCRVTGVDLTQEYIETADALARRVGLAARVSYRQASALALPFDPGTFDGAYMMHVGMNIEDKAALFAEVRRVLKAGSTFAIFDVMRSGPGELRFPLHWAATSETSFVVSAAEYRSALEAAGFASVKERDRGDFARAFFREVVARAAEAGRPPPLGIHILMKTDVPQKLASYVSNLEAGLIAPVELIYRAR
ncbi:MAG: methyltransferase domain-containing protein [Rhizobiales bacterium]|nr:methyltransferase domain-containing protein [Hyphomicrobiales bacterium]